ncbi:hypothetical protein HJA90_10760 [Rhizobium bangladeshense]|uniref:hypothetical protein n=1 Tax=Rhizobium bangladeshense TaxID=1138189 RepID=UPI001C83D678|nr:hypothetical protein [Rhizobium bangladeshense]MBX4884064.1 hypothetical protein [Rhizobium bangladeshense]
MYPLEFRNENRVADEAEMTSEVETALKLVRDDLAAMLVSKNDDLRIAMRDMVGKLIAKHLMRRYQVAAIDRTADWYRPSTGGGKWSESGQMTP